MKQIQLLALLLAALLCASCTTTRSVTSDHAGEAIGSPVILTMSVRQMGQSRDGRYLELYSKASWDTPGCVFIRLPRSFIQRATRLGITDLQSLLTRRDVEVRGVPQWLVFPEFPDHRIVCLTLKHADDLRILPKAYRTHKTHGFLIQVDAVPAEIFVRELAELEQVIEGKLKEISEMVPKKALEEMQKVPITIRRGLNPSSAAYDWRIAGIQNHLHPGPSRGIMINNWYEFMRTSREDQPLALLHELAHAYHNRVLGGDHEGVLAAYRNAMDQGLYENVARRGVTEKERAYAATNEMEYFCEITEAWFGFNDYFPFNKEELQRHDPMAAALMQEVWGTPLKR